MAADTDHLQRYYSSLSDEALKEIDRADLTTAAQNYYDQEVTRRQFASISNRTDTATEETPGWLSEASEVFSVTDRAGEYAAKDAERARDVLEAAGIPCFPDMAEDYLEDVTNRPLRRRRISVPGRFNMQATSIPERDIYNEEFEADWKNHLEMLTDQDLSEARPNQIFCGLFDRIERVVRVYNDELSRRRLHP